MGAFKLATLVACGFTAMGSVQSLHAQSLVTNGGFESPGFGGPDFYLYLANSTANAMTGWTVTFDGQVEASFWMKVGGPYDSLIGAGSYGLTLNEGDLLTTSISVTSGQEYQVSFLAKTDSNLISNALKVTAAGNLATFSPTSTFTTYSYNFTASSTGPVSLVFEVDSSNSAPQVVNMDNVSVVAVPEPASAMLAGTALLGLALRRRRQVAA